MAPRRTKLVKLAPIVLPNTLQPEPYLLGNNMDMSAEEAIFATISVASKKKIVSHKGATSSSNTSTVQEPVIVKKKVIKKKEL